MKENIETRMKSGSINFAEIEEELAKESKKQ